MKTTKMFLLIIAAVMLAGCARLGVHVEVYPPEKTPIPEVTNSVNPIEVTDAAAPIVLVTEDPAPTAEPVIGGASGILFASNGGGVYKDLYFLEFASSETTRLTQGESNVFPGPFSPDGKKIAYTGFGLTNSYVGVMNADGSNPLDLTNLPDVDDGFPVWSPDGTLIAFTSRRSGNNEIFVMDPWGYNIVQLIENPTDDFAPTWSPDGKQVAFGPRQ